MSEISTPGHDDLREGDLLAYLDGAARPAVAAHVAACPRCQAELAGLRAAAAILGAALGRADCPGAETLLLLQAGLLDPAAAAAARAHVAGCDDCAAELALLADPPAPSAAGQLLRAGARLIRALLQPAAPPALALRGGQAAPRRALFAAEGHEIVVAVTPERPPAGGFAVEGQVLTPAGVQPGSARLSVSDGAEREAVIDELGFFVFDAVPPGAYVLVLTLAEADVIAEPLDVP